MSKKSVKQKPIFNIKLENSDDEIKISAGGVILYRIKNGVLELLLMTNRNKYEDLGGTSDVGDLNIYDTVSREVSEESNELIDIKSIMDRIQKSDYILSKTCKYIIFIIKANDKERNLVSEQFGDREIHDDIPRTISWVPISEFLKSDTIKNNLNFRLKNRNIFEALKKLDPNNDPDSSKEQAKNIMYLF